MRWRSLKKKKSATSCACLSLPGGHPNPAARQRSLRLRRCPARTQAARPVAAQARRADHLQRLLNPASLVALIPPPLCCGRHAVALRARVLGQHLLLSHCVWCEQRPLLMFSICSRKYFGARGSEHWLQVLPRLCDSRLVLAQLDACCGVPVHCCSTSPPRAPGQVAKMIAAGQ